MKEVKCLEAFYLLPSPTLHLRFTCLTCEESTYGSGENDLMLQHVAATKRAVLETAHYTFLLSRSYASTSTSTSTGTQRRDEAGQQHTTPASGQLRSKSAPLTIFNYEISPQPFNCTTHYPTRAIAADPSHPFYIKVQRRVAAHNPEDFVWTVRCPMQLSKKPTYRHDVQKKLRRAFRAALRRKGYDEQGYPLREADLAKMKEAGMEVSRKGVNHHDAADARDRLGGALVMTFVVNDKVRVLTAKGHEFRAEAERILDKVLQKRYAAKKGPVDGRRTRDTFSASRNAYAKRASEQEWQRGLMKSQRAEHAARPRSAMRPHWQRDHHRSY
jgi:hypothetical protein